MSRNRKILGAFFLAFVLSSCGLFKKKNKCVSCPTWDEIEIGAEVELECESE